MSQLDYNVEMRASLNGLEADSAGAYKKKDTYIASEEIPFGAGVVLDVSGQGLCMLPDADDNQFLGVALLDPTGPEGSASVDSAYPVEAAVCVMKQGDVWVRVEDTVTPGDPVFVRFTAGAGGTVLGRFRADADTASAFEVTNARWKTTADGSTTLYAKLELNIP